MGDVHNRFRPISCNSCGMAERRRTRRRTRNEGHTELVVSIPLLLLLLFWDADSLVVLFALVRWCFCSFAQNTWDGVPAVLERPSAALPRRIVLVKVEFVDSPHVGLYIYTFKHWAGLRQKLCAHSKVSVCVSITRRFSHLPMYSFFFLFSLGLANV